MLSILFTKIPDQVPRKSRSDSEDMQKFSKVGFTICRKHMPWGIGTESLGMIGCIFAENGPLEDSIESSMNGTVRGAKGVFRRFSYLYPYIFESRTHTFFGP